MSRGGGGDRTLLDGFRLAVGTLTVLPAGPVAVTPAVARTAMLLAPLAVAPVAAVAAAAGWLLALRGAPDLLAGLAVVGVVAALTRGLHLDGLADTTDGFGVGGARDRALAVMRAGDVGPFGVVALVAVVVAQAAAAGALLAVPGGAVTVAVALCCSRAALAVACRTGVPAARSDGLGAAVAGTVPGVAAVVSGLGVLGVLVAAAGPAAGASAAVVAAAAVHLVVARAVARFGGVTGDVLGAAVEVAATAVLVVLVLR